MITRHKTAQVAGGRKNNENVRCQGRQIVQDDGSIGNFPCRPDDLKRRKKITLPTNRSEKKTLGENRKWNVRSPRKVSTLPMNDCPSEMHYSIPRCRGPKGLGDSSNWSGVHGAQRQAGAPGIDSDCDHMARRRVDQGETPVRTIA